MFGIRCWMNRKLTNHSTLKRACGAELMHYQLMHRHFLFCVGVGSRRFFVAMSIESTGTSCLAMMKFKKHKC